ncbi:hypothetical protein C5Y96_11615 [Blastopirellula marina]|uniref:Tyrosine specific protein phosphatases domain-containing protein n=1 Tax=Blastopirellula marina TaxID=124 RepID=A0A2S8FMQ7_9BACT|nr:MULTISPECIES: hypothetical protein [Pirellulaceae]PQO33479.1 hypothetical protein C5Y96_11615 [Blastopirellula marina]RCS52570.1 hypothetical protein DTL36_11625 [Bremerella cremea]
MRPEMIQALQEGVYPVTTRIAIGRFPAPGRCVYLLEKGYTHILNVSDAPSLASTRNSGFAEVKDLRIDDFMRIPTQDALDAVGSLYGMLNVPGSLVYLHCIAGQMRSPTILWLYLVGLGMNEDAARQMIVEHCPDAHPGSATLIDAKLIASVQEWGQKLGYIDRASLMMPALS